MNDKIDTVMVGGRSDGPQGPVIDRRRFAQGAAVTVGLAAAGSLPRPAIGQTTGPLKVAVLLPRSGFLAQPGQSSQRGADIAPAILAERGIQIELMNADIESNADVARARAERAIQEGAHVIVGAFDSGMTTAIAQVCEQRGVPLVVNIAAAPQLTEQGYRTLVRNFPTSRTLMTNGLGLIRDLFATAGRTPETAVLLFANDTFGQANKAAFDVIYPQIGLSTRVLDSISYDPRAQNLSVEVQKGRATGAELVLCFTRANDAINLVREMVRQRWEPMGIITPGGPGFYDEQFYRTLGRFSDYVISNVPWYDPTAPLSQRLEAEFKRAFPNDRWEYYAFNAGFTFEAILIAAEAYRRAGSTAPDALIREIRATNLTDKMMVGGPIAFDEKGQNNSIGSACVQNRNQIPTVVLPKSAAVAEPVFPMPGWQTRG